MKKFNLIVSVLVIAVVMSVAVLSQITSIASKTNQITPTISLEEKETCTTTFYDEVQNVYGTCVDYYNITSCLNSSGPNTGCSSQPGSRNFSCKTGQATVTKNSTDCTPNDNFIISIDDGTAVLKRQIDFSTWGPCIYNEENNCLIVTCVSNDDGAFRGKFTDCKGGKSCQRFEICDSSIKTLYKNSREGFSENDPSFYLNKLAVQEVTE